MNFKQTYFSIWQDIWNLHKKYAFIRYPTVGKSYRGSKPDKYTDSVGEKFAEALLFAVTAEIDRKAK